eukprot:Sdes_comp20206_c0_seq1m13528
MASQGKRKNKNLTTFTLNDFLINVSPPKTASWAEEVRDPSPPPSIPAPQPASSSSSHSWSKPVASEPPAQFNSGSRSSSKERGPSQLTKSFFPDRGDCDAKTGYNDRYQRDSNSARGGYENRESRYDNRDRYQNQDRYGSRDRYDTRERYESRDRYERRRENTEPTPLDLTRVPKNPPFTAFVGNLSYDIKEEDLRQFFEGFPIVSVRIPKNDADMSGRSRGYGYVEFETADSLIEACALSGKTLLERSLKIDISESREKDRTHDDWNRAKTGPLPPLERRQQEDRYDRKRSDREGFRRPVDGKEEAKPASKPIEFTRPENPKPSTENPFGGAKPVDTSAREREIEAKLAKKREEDKLRAEVESQPKSEKDAPETSADKGWSSTRPSRGSKPVSQRGDRASRGRSERSDVNRWESDPSQLESRRGAPRSGFAKTRGESVAKDFRNLNLKSETASENSNKKTANLGKFSTLQNEADE